MDQTEETNGHLPPDDSSTSQTSTTAPVASTTGRLKLTFKSPLRKAAEEKETAAKSSNGEEQLLSAEPALPSPSNPKVTPSISLIAPIENGLNIEYVMSPTERARSVLSQIFAAQKENVQLLPPSTSTTPDLQLKQDVIIPGDPQEALLMIAALKTIGRKDAMLLLEEEAPNMVLDEQILSSRVGSIIKLTDKEAMLVRNAAKSAKSAVRANASKWEEDDESLALELELEFTQLDPVTRVELLKQVDAAETNSFFSAGKRAERLSAATREATFHNAQLSFDRSRIGPYYLDPHSKTLQVFHSLQVPHSNDHFGPPIVSHPSDPNLTIYNPDFPIPNGFKHFKQSLLDFHPTLHSQLKQNVHVKYSTEALTSSTSYLTSSLGLLHQALTTSNPSSLQSFNMDQSSGMAHSASKTVENLNDIKQSVYVNYETHTDPNTMDEDGEKQYEKWKEENLRYSVMDGYVQWLKKELESHWATASPLLPHDSWASQFKSQWEVLQPKGVFDFVSSGLEGNMVGNSTSTTDSTSSPITAPTSTTSKLKNVSAAFRQVWKEHKRHLQAEQAVQLAMEGAERTLKRIRFGDPSDAEIDPSKPLTRDERRKIAKREKEYPKLMEMFLTTKLVDPKEFNLSKLTWYDFQVLFASLGLSTQINTTEEDGKNARQDKGPSRSHKKGAARAARIAAKKAATTTNPSSDGGNNTDNENNNNDINDEEMQADGRSKVIRKISAAKITSSQSNTPTRAPTQVNRLIPSNRSSSKLCRVKRRVKKAGRKESKDEEDYETDYEQEDEEVTTHFQSRKNSVGNDINQSGRGRFGRGSSVVQNMCDMCSTEVNPVEDESLTCTECLGLFHTHCLEISHSTTLKALGYTWKCPYCKVCEQCGENTQEDRMLICDSCDRALHSYCADPPLEKLPLGDWLCPECNH